MAGKLLIGNRNDYPNIQIRGSSGARALAHKLEEGRGMRGLNKGIVTVVIVLLASTLWAADREALKERYERLESRYKRLQKTGANLSEAERSIPQIQEAKKSKDLQTLSSLLDRFEADLNRISNEPAGNPLPPAHSEPVSPSSASKKDEVISLQNLYRRDLFKIALQKKGESIKPGGAVGRNEKKFTDVAAQREAIWAIRLGVAAGNRDIIRRGVEAIEYAFQRQDPRGNFRNGLGVNAKTAVGADAFFLHAFGHVYLLLSQSPYKDELLPQLKSLEPKLKLAMAWLKENEQELYRQDSKTPNRLAFDGLAFLLNGVAFNEPRWIQTGKEFLKRTLQGQREDGVFVEHGGHDSSYQAVSLLNLEIAWFYLNDADDASFRGQIYRAIEKGMQWEKARILPTGEVRVEGNTRTGLGQEKFFGKEKDVNYAEVALSLFYWSQIGDDAEAAGLADKVINYALSGRSKKK